MEIVVTLQPLTARLPSRLQLLRLDADAAALAERPACAPFVSVSGDNAAYVLYTSGATGRPKGVVVPHRALAQLVESVGRRYRLAPSDRVLQLSSAAFDLAGEEIFPALAAGAAVVPWTDREPPSPRELSRFLARHAITVMCLPSASWHEWASLGADVPLPPSLRLVIAGGEAVAPDRLRTWRSDHPNRPEWLNAYGVIEAGVTSVVDDGATLAADTPRLPIGQALDGVTAYVLDVEARPLPAGEAGELCLGGRGVARGYLDRPRLTAERFIPDPFASQPGARLYRTGDRARVRPDGKLELLGRLDQQIKRHGHRVELGEVEAALLAHPAIDDAAVVPRGDDELCAYVVGEEPLDEAALRSFLAERLPGYMMPTAFAALASLPLGPGDEVDRAALARNAAVKASAA